MESIEDLMMTKQPFCTVDDTIRKVSQMMVAHNTPEIVIVDNEKHFFPVGIVYERDINNCCIAHGRDPSSTQTRECMKKLKVTIKNDMSPEQCIDILEKNSLESAPVINDQNKFCGIVTKDELVRLFTD